MSLLQTVSLFILLVVLIFQSSDAVVPVLDTGGRKVTYSLSYCILEVIHVNWTDVIVGGLDSVGINPYPECHINLTSVDDACCVRSIKKVSVESNIGDTAKFSQTNQMNPILLSTETTIRVSGSVYNMAVNCRADFVWRFKYDETSKQHYVITGRDCCGTAPSFDGRSWFRVERSGKYYSILGCYRLCEGCKAVCKGIGYKMIRGEKLLTFSDVPAKFVFMLSTW